MITKRSEDYVPSLYHEYSTKYNAGIKIKTEGGD